MSKLKTVQTHHNHFPQSMLSTFRTYNVIVQNFIRNSIVFPIILKFCGKVVMELSPAALRCCCRIFSHNVNTLAINPQIKCNQFKFHTSIFIRNLFCILLMESELQRRRWSLVAPPQLAVGGSCQLPGKEPVNGFLKFSIHRNGLASTVATDSAQTNE